MFGVFNPFTLRVSYTSVICSGCSDTTLSRPGFRDKELMMDTWSWRFIYFTADAASLLHFTRHTKSLLHQDTN
jgi:hypothetical protein